MVIPVIVTLSDDDPDDDTEMDARESEKEGVSRVETLPVVSSVIDAKLTDDEGDDDSVITAVELLGTLADTLRDSDG